MHRYSYYEKEYLEETEDQNSYRDLAMTQQTKLSPDFPFCLSVSQRVDLYIVNI